VKRKVFENLTEHYSKKEHSIITGSRQVGKTTLLKQLFENYYPERNPQFYISLEDYSILKLLDEHPEKIFDIIKIRPETGKRIILYIDEIQYLKDPSNFLKYMFDMYNEKIKIIATGSSAFYIDKKFRDSLAGRKRLFELYTLGFDEFLDFKNHSELKEDWFDMRKNFNLKPLKIQILKNLFNEYIIYGGYPAVVLEESIESKKLILNELTTTYLKRDILESNINNEYKFLDLLKILAEKPGTLLNTNEISNTLKLSSPTVESYINILRKCFHINLLRPFYRNIRKEISKMPKVYFNDTGFRNSLINNFQPVFERVDKGHVIENYCFIRLRQIYGDDKINFWRNKEKNEIDFVVSEIYNKGYAVEVKYNFDEYNPNKYKSFTKSYPDYPLKCIAYNSPHPKNELIRL
jgi:uncharacterized protein